MGIEIVVFDPLLLGQFAWLSGAPHLPPLVSYGWSGRPPLEVSLMGSATSLNEEG